MSGVTGRHALSRPIERRFRGPEGERVEQVTEVTVRKPLAGDLRATDGAGGEHAATLAMIAHLTGLSQEAIDKLAMADFNAIGAIVEAYHAAGFPAGATPTLTLREPLAGDLRAMDGHAGEASKMIAFVARLADVGIARVEALEVGEFEALVTVAQGFTQPGRPTGPTASAS